MSRCACVDPNKESQGLGRGASGDPLATLQALCLGVAAGSVYPVSWARPSMTQSLLPFLFLALTAAMIKLFFTQVCRQGRGGGGRLAHLVTVRGAQWC